MDKQIARIGPFRDLIAGGVRAGDLLTLSGQVAVDEAGAPVGAGDFAAQLRQIYTNVLAVLAEFDARPGSIVDETWFVTDVQDVLAGLDRILPIREEVLGVPTRDTSQTLVQVAGLVMPELLVEVKCIARL